MSAEWTKQKTEIDCPCGGVARLQAKHNLYRVKCKCGRLTVLYRTPDDAINGFILSCCPPTAFMSELVNL